MDSTHLAGFGFINWYPFNKQTVRHSPTNGGVYVIRFSNGRTFGRVTGESDIIYIGKAESKNGLKGRLIRYFWKSRRTTTEYRINKFNQDFDLDFSWHLTQKPKDLEMRLLKKYLEEHYQLPPLNRVSINLVRDYRDLKAGLIVKH